MGGNRRLPVAVGLIGGNVVTRLRGVRSRTAAAPRGWRRCRRAGRGRAHRFFGRGVLKRELARIADMRSLDQMKEWPVDNAAATVLADGTEYSSGEDSRIYDLASVTKLVAAYGFLMAMEEGVFELDTPLGPEGATVRHLLAHASGVGFDDPEPEREPGERRIYSSAGFEILADAVSAEAGMPFSEYLLEGVFKPLGMKDSELYGSAGHQMRSTLDDLRNFAKEVLNPTLLHESTVAEALSVQFEGLDGVVPGYGMQKPNPWGLGFELRGDKSPHWTGPSMPADVAGHFGQSGTFFWVHRPTQRAMIVLTDRGFGSWAKPLWSETNEAIWQELRG